MRLRRRLALQVIATFRRECEVRNSAELGRYHVILVEGPAKRSSEDNPRLVGRVDNGKRCVIPGTYAAATYACTPLL